MNIKTMHYEIIGSNIPKELSGYRIALFSDTHNCSFGENNEELIAPLEAFRPDIVVFAGDSISKHRYDTEVYGGLDNALKLFHDMGDRFDVYYINGNHDARLQELCNGGDPFADCFFWKKAEKARKNLPESPPDVFGDYIKAIKDAGIKVISGRQEIIADGRLALTGLELPLKYYLHRCDSPDINVIKALIPEPAPGAFNILAAHDPQHFDLYREWGADLSLCGHMHGCIVRLPLLGGVFSPYRTFFPKYDYGRFDKDQKTMLITSGCCKNFFRTRFSNPLEIVSITLLNNGES
ncbi:MAG: metallophosphoesterase family protein [Lachnospiraceae bacterium]|nr:metallophosphoesterase family protein [Lachnospiraceae bacterium]